MHRYGLHDDQWELIKDLLPGREGSVGVSAADNRLFVEAVLSRRTAIAPVSRGVTCRNASARKNVHRRFSPWAKSSIWQRVFTCSNRGDNEYAMIDSTITRAH